MAYFNTFFFSFGQLYHSERLRRVVVSDSNYQNFLKANLSDVGSNKLKYEAFCMKSSILKKIILQILQKRLCEVLNLTFRHVHVLSLFFQKCPKSLFLVSVSILKHEKINTDQVFC